MMLAASVVPPPTTPAKRIPPRGPLQGTPVDRHDWGCSTSSTRFPASTSGSGHAEASATPAGAPTAEFSGSTSPPLRRPYCASCYDVDPEQDAAARVTQLRSKIRSLHSLRSRVPASESSDGQWGHSPPVQTQEWQPAPPAVMEQVRPCLDEPSTPPLSYHAQGRLASILNFLDDVEESSRADVTCLASSARSSAPQVNGIAGSGAARMTLADGAAELQSTIALFEIEVHALRQALLDAEAHEKQALLDQAGAMEDRFEKQRIHYEAGLERHLKLVDRLLGDKTELTKRCEALAEEVKAVEHKFQKSVEHLEQQATKELGRQKQNWMAAEKLRREAWQKDKVREIKEMTVKGLQPEVERLLAERRQDKARFEERQRDALEKQRQELLELTQEKVQEAREYLIREHDMALDGERQAHQRRLREEFERFSEQLQDERSRYSADMLAERHKQEQLLQSEREQFESDVRDALAGERAKAETKTAELQTLQARCKQLEQAADDLKAHHKQEQERLTKHERRVRTLEEENEALLTDSQATLEGHANELRRMAEVAQQEAASRQEEIRLLNAQVGAEQKHVEELKEESLRREEKTIGELEARVKLALQAKDCTIRELRTQCVAAQNKVREFEHLLARQREELLGSIIKNPRCT